ncbi:MAG TPA: GspH/FimT family pseudopilin [Steroidobacteraceae bacterium]|nr:GspH/FimT family pseudopilin [Steroidobacteraceae bacterium]
MSFRDPQYQSKSRAQSAARGRVALAGFTLLELIVTMAVAGILMAIAVPSFRSFLQSDRLLTEQDQLVMSLHLARSEAIKQDTSIDVCASSNGTTCSGLAEWNDGWIVQAAGAAQPLQVVSALATGNRLTEANGVKKLTFDATGLATSIAVALQFTFCDTRGASYARYTEVGAFSGRVASSGTVGKNLAGAALACP